MPLRRWRVVLCLAALTFARAAVAGAAEAPEAPPPAAPAPASQPAGDTAPADDLSKQIAELLTTAQQALDAKPPPPEALLNVYGRAKTLLDEAGSDLAKRKSLLAEAQAAPERLTALKAELKEELPPLPSAPPPSESLAEVEKAHAAAATDLRKLQQAREPTDARIRELERRLGEIPDEIASAEQSLAEARKRLEETPPDDPVGMAAAKKMLRRAEANRATAALGRLQAEQQHAGVVGNVVRVQLAVLDRRIDHAQKVDKHWSEVLKAKQRTQSLQFLRKAREVQQAFAGKHRVLRDLCDETVALAEEATGPDGVIVRRRKVEARHQEVDAKVAEIQKDYEDIQAHLKVTGVTKTAGNLLIEQRRDLPRSSVIESHLAARRRELDDARLRSLQIRKMATEARKDGPDLLTALGKMEVAQDTPAWDAAQQDAQRILDVKHELLTELAKRYTAYQVELSDTIAAEQQLLKTVEEVASLVNEQVLWVPGMSTLSLGDFRLAGKAVRELGKKSVWGDLAKDAREDLNANPVLSGGLLLAALVLLAARFPLRWRIRQIGRQVAEHPPGTFRATLETVMWTVLSAAAWPALLWIVAWRLIAMPPTAATTARVSDDLNTVGYLLWALFSIGEVFQHKGLAAVHLKWDRVRLAGYRRAVQLIVLLATPLILVNVITNAHPTDDACAALGRLAVIARMLVAAGLLAVLLRPKSRLVRGGGNTPEAGFLSRQWWLWYPVAVALPLVLAGASATGYTYTAVALGPRILLSAFLLPTMVIVRDVVVRGLWLSRRHIVREEVRKRRQAEQEADVEPDHEFEKSMLREAVEQVTSVSRQTARLVNHVLLGALLLKLYFIWQDLLPALQFLYRTDLYVVGDVEVTLADLLAAILAVGITAVAVRTLPGMLDVYVLSRLGMDDGGRFALATLLRYLLAAAGVIVTSSCLGMTWGSVQWIVAALGVGLGFGLQEIVANLISGLLILFERQIRIRDFVTVGDTTGRVTGIRMRCTMVTDWDGKEVVIPNKEFVTGRVVNWTLSQRTIRLVIPVGLAYGSDTRRAEEILVRVGCENEFTLEDPPVRAYFLGFGTSSLDFELRVWLPDMENWVEVRHQLHRAIDDAFHEAGITVAYPQLDLHWNAPLQIESPSGGSPANPGGPSRSQKKASEDGPPERGPRPA